MSEKLVRTQICLPPAMRERLVQRAAAQGLTLSAQIRAALDEYLASTAANEEGDILQPADPLFELAGQFDSGLDDLGRNHDRYLYR